MVSTFLSSPGCTDAESVSNFLRGAQKVLKKKVGVGLELWLSSLERREVREEGLRTV